MKVPAALKILLIFAALLLAVPQINAATQGGKLDSLLLYNRGLASIHPTQAIDNCREIRQQALKVDDSIYYAEAVFIEGQANFKLYNFTKASDRFQEALLIFQQYNNFEGIAKSDIQSGLIDLRIGDYYQALSKFEKAENLCEQKGLHSLEAEADLNIGRVHLAKSDTEKAKSAVHNAIEAAKANNDQHTKAWAYTVMAEILISEDELKKGEDYLTNAIIIFKNDGDQSGIAKSNALLARIALQQQKYELAGKNIQEALRITDELDLPYEKAEYLLIYSNVMIDTGNVKVAIATTEQAYRLLENLPASKGLDRDIEKQLSQAYLAVGDSAKALSHLMDFQKLDNQFRNENLHELTLLQQFKAQKSANEQLNSTNLLKDKLIDRSKILLLIMAALVVVCVLLIFALSRNIAKKKKFSKTLIENNEIITKKQEQLDQQQKELIAKNEQLQELDKTKNKVFSVITHDLRQPINQVKSVLTLLEMEELNDEDRLDIVEKLKDSIDSSSNALENLLLWSKKQLTGINTKIVDVHLLPQVLQLEGHMKSNLQAKEINLIIKVPDFFKVKADMNQLDICLRNLLTNAIKFSNRGSNITINASQESSGDKVIRVIDEGVGMTPEQVEQLNTLSGNFSTLGTMNEKGTGLGILITKEFMQNQNGELRISSRAGQGSIFSLVFHANNPSQNGSVEQKQQPSPAKKE